MVGDFIFVDEIMFFFRICFLSDTMKYIFIFLLCLLFVSCHKIDTLRLMTYNVHHCRGIDDKIDYERIADVIKRTSPDFVALQELDSATVRNGGKVCIDEIACRTNMHSSYASAIKFDGGGYGIGLLSKEAPSSVKVVPLSGREENRILLFVEFEKCVVCCTHFSLNGDDRKTSSEIVCEVMKGINKPLFLAGDMNCHVDDPEQVVLNKCFIALNDCKKYTYPSIEPKECIDFIYALDNGFSYNVKESIVLTDDSVASDHLPLYVDIEYN